MKKVSVLLLIIITASFAANGQEFSIGFKPSFLIIGAKYTQEPEIWDINPTIRASYAFGISLEYKVNKLIAFKAEPRYIAKGYNIKWSPEDEDIYRNNYISLPILANFSPIKNLSVEVGTDICYLFSSGYKQQGMQSFNKNDSHNLKKLEFSLLTGVGYSFSKRFDFGARYALGLTAYDKGEFLISDWTGPQVNYKFEQNYFEFYLNTKFLTKSKNK